MKMTRRSALKSSALAASALALRGTHLFSQTSVSADAHIDILPGEPIATISPEIYGHFIEHLGGVVYDGVWVGTNSRIANTGGVRQSFIDAMRSVGASLLRWPGGCFADSYDWRDGIGAPASRPPRTGFWTQQETNRYGLHEFMHTCRAIGAKPYLAADMRTLPARDFYQELEYCNAPAGNVPSNSAAPAMPNSLAAQRATNGDRDPFNVDLWGVGNESWGCGGNLEPEEYAAMYRRFTAWTPSYGDMKPRFVAVGGNGDDVDFTRRMFKALYANTEKRNIFGLSIHYYTSGSGTEFAAGDALKFSDAEHYDMLARGSMMDGIIRDQWTAIQTTQQPGQPAARLIVDEWGGWYGNGTRLGPTYNLSQQSTMRDALLTGITLDIFQRHAEKVAAACVAQSINCLHSLVLAMGDQSCVTPAYHVFKMYLPHHGAQAVRAEFSAAGIPNPLAKTALQMDGINYAGPASGSRVLAGLSGSASISATNPKQLTLTVVNPHLDRPITTEIAVGGAGIASASGSVLNAPDIHAHNDFAHPDAVKPVAAAVGAPSGGRLMYTFPPASVTSLQITLS